MTRMAITYGPDRNVHPSLRRYEKYSPGLRGPLRKYSHADWKTWKNGRVVAFIQNADWNLSMHILSNVDFAYHKQRK